MACEDALKLHSGKFVNPKAFTWLAGEWGVGGFQLTVCCCRYGIPNDECRKDKHHGYTYGLADRGKFGAFDALEKTPGGVGPGLYKVNEVRGVL